MTYHQMRFWCSLCPSFYFTNIALSNPNNVSIIFQFQFWLIFDFLFTSYQSWLVNRQNEISWQLAHLSISLAGYSLLENKVQLTTCLVHVYDENVGSSWPPALLIYQIALTLAFLIERHDARRAVKASRSPPEGQPCCIRAPQHILQAHIQRFPKHGPGRQLFKVHPNFHMNVTIEFQINQGS